MANSIPDVNLQGDWVNLFTATGIAAGTALTIQSKAAKRVLIYISPTRPTNMDDGYLMKFSEVISIASGETGVWALGAGRLFVQAST